MINFKHPEGRFNFRAAAIIIFSDHVLLHKAKHDNFWSLPGGRVEMLESSALTVQRELEEELGLRTNVQRLLWLVENFFSYDYEDFHELGFYYLLDVSGEDREDSLFDVTKVHESIEEGNTLDYNWFPISDLKDMIIYPSFLRTGLMQLPEDITHLIHYDT